MFILTLCHVTLLLAPAVISQFFEIFYIDNNVIDSFLKNFISFFQSVYLPCFSCLLTLDRTYSIMLNETGERDIFLFFFLLGEKYLVSLH